MNDRLRAPTIVSAARIGRTDLGEAAIVLEDDALCVVVREAPGQRPLRIELRSIDAVSLAGNEVMLPLRGGTQLTIVCESAIEIREAILDGCRALPELTSALRTFGSRRGNRSMRETAAEEQRRFYAPMLRARRAAGDALTPSGTIAAFDVAALVDSTHRALRAFAESRFGDPGPGRRALEAELFEANEALDASFQHLLVSASDAADATEDLALWRAWAAQLRATFEAADRVWLLIDGALEAAPPPIQMTGQKQKKAKRP